MVSTSAAKRKQTRDIMMGTECPLFKFLCKSRRAHHSREAPPLRRGTGRRWLKRAQVWEARRSAGEARDAIGKYCDVRGCA